MANRTGATTGCKRSATQSLEGLGSLGLRYDEWPFVSLGSGPGRPAEVARYQLRIGARRDRSGREASTLRPEPACPLSTTSMGPAWGLDHLPHFGELVTLLSWGSRKPVPTTTSLK